MLKRDRGAFFAIGLVVGLGLALLFLVWAVPEFRSPTFAKQYYADWHVAAQVGQSGKPDDTHFWIRELYGWVYAEDTLAQWIMAVFAIVATGTSIWAVLLLRNTLVATRDAVRSADDAVTVTRELGEAQTRAYVHVESAELRWGNPKGEHPRVTFTAINTGQTPAKWFECHATFFTRKLTKEGFYAENITFDDLDLTGITAHRWNALGGGRELTFTAASKSANVARSSYGRTDVSLDVAGILRYETFFGEIFETEFWFAVRPPPTFKLVTTPGPEGFTPYQGREAPNAMQRATGNLRTYHRVDDQK